MKNFNLTERIISYTAVFASALLLAACNSSPSIPSSGTPSSLPPTGAPPSSSPSSIPSSSPSPSSSPQPSSMPGTKSGGQPSPGSTTSAQGDASSQGTESDGETSSRQASSGQRGEKTDDQILAEALEELGRRNQTAAGNNNPNENGNNQTPGSYGTGDQQVAGADPGDGSLTDAEKSEELNKQLDEKFAKFDNIILGEREGVTRENNEQGGGRGTGDYGTGTGGNEDGPLQTAMIDRSPRSGGPGIKSDKKSDSVSTPPPADVGNGQDDDIIARQLREAAMKEQDPELRAKLWDEYRKYKKGS